MLFTKCKRLTTRTITTKNKPTMFQTIKYTTTEDSFTLSVDGKNFNDLSNDDKVDVFATYVNNENFCAIDAVSFIWDYYYKVVGFVPFTDDRELREVSLPQLKAMCIRLAVLVDKDEEKITDLMCNAIAMFLEDYGEETECDGYTEYSIAI